MAGLTAVDGATVITDRYELLAFGAKIVRRDGSSEVREVVMTEPIEGGRAEIVEPSQLRGTRHLSAAQFTRDQHDAVALVASQDGRFTVFAWSPCENMVRAHRSCHSYLETARKRTRTKHTHKALATLPPRRPWTKTRLAAKESRSRQVRGGQVAGLSRENCQDMRLPQRQSRWGQALPRTR